MQSGGAVAGDADRVLHHGAHAALIDFAHCINVDAGGANVMGLVAVNIADTYQSHILRGDHRGEAT